MRGRIAWIVAVPWLAFTAVRATGLDGPVGHPLVSAVAFTPYALLTAGIPVVLALLLRQWAPAAVSGAALVVLAVIVLPRAFGGNDPPPLSELRSITVMSVNLQYGLGDVETVMRIAERRDVDAIALQELTPEAVERFRGARVRGRFPVQDLASEEAEGGEGVIATREVPRDVEVVSVHPVPPTTRARVRQWREVLEALPPAREDGKVRILAGDFNATLDHAELRSVLGRGYEDAAARTGNGLAATWPVGRRLLPVTIDHVLFPQGGFAWDYSRHRIPGSDHRAVVVSVSLPD